MTNVRDTVLAVLTASTAKAGVSSTFLMLKLDMTPKTLSKMIWRLRTYDSQPIFTNHRVVAGKKVAFYRLRKAPKVAPVVVADQAPVSATDAIAA